MRYASRFCCRVSCARANPTTTPAYSLYFNPRRASDDKKKRLKVGGAKRESAEGQAKRSLSERALNAWRGLRPALEVGATERERVTAMESTSDEQAKASLKTANPRGDLEEDLTNDDAKRLMTRELATPPRERDAAAQRVARRAVVRIEEVALERESDDDDDKGSAASDADAASR